jgi:P27 family predicted phage terminase small subunit
MKPGPRPKPTRLKKLAGNPGKRPLNKREAYVPRGEIPKCPSHLLGMPRNVWYQLAPRVYEVGLLSEISSPLFACLCQAIATNIKATKMISKTGGEVVRGSVGQLKTNPWVTIAKNAKVEIIRFGDEFGLTPASVSRATATDMEQMSLEDALFGAKTKVKR